MIGALTISVIYVMVFGEDVETETVPAPTMEVVEFERPLMAVMPVPPVLETLAGVQKLPFQLRTWFAAGVEEEIGCPWRPTTVWDVELPERSPPAVKLPMPQPVQEPLTTRFCRVVVGPVIVAVPGKVAVMPERPIVMPVAEDAPMEIVPVVSTRVFESPVMLVAVNVSEAKAIETPPAIATMMREMTKAGSLLFRNAYMVSGG